jgi:hypothetical protein
VPVKRGKIRDGPYYQWGDSGKKYHYTSGDERSRTVPLAGPPACQNLALVDADRHDEQIDRSGVPRGTDVDG